MCDDVQHVAAAVGVDPNLPWCEWSRMEASPHKLGEKLVVNVQYL